MLTSHWENRDQSSIEILLTILLNRLLGDCLIFRTKVLFVNRVNQLLKYVLIAISHCLIRTLSPG